MKTKITILALSLAAQVLAQKPTIAVLNIDSKGMVNNSEEMGSLTRLELEKTNAYAVLDRYEVMEVAATHSIDIKNCFSKSCLTDVGRLLKVNKMLSGSVERLGEKIIVTMRIIDVTSSVVEKTDATEYLNLPEVQKMIAISIKKIVGQEPDPNLVKLLIDYDVPIESPKNTLKLNGPRMGIGTTLGKNYEILTGDNKKAGQFGMLPASFQFGWQQESQYISAGSFQALIENLFTVSGLESGRFIPSYSPMLGFRFGKGWEFGFGPNFRLVKKARGFYDEDNRLGKGENAWHLESDWPYMDSTYQHNPNPYQIESRIDSRGRIALSTGLVIAFGKTFRSGYLNIPVNVYVAPRKDGTTIGIMCGFNIQKKNKTE
jgi:TolB-like protein